MLPDQEFSTMESAISTEGSLGWKLESMIPAVLNQSNESPTSELDPD